MEIYQAAQENETRRIGDGGVYHDLTDWFVTYYSAPLESGWIIERTVKDSYIGSLPQFKELSRLTHISKQRGGYRFFKTLDAAANAIKQIGQESFEVHL